MSIPEKWIQIQRELQSLKIDGWLIYDFRRTNDLACRILEIPLDKILTRRFFYWIPSSGTPVKIVHAIENPLEHLPGETCYYRTWQELENCVSKILKSGATIAMEYSPRNAIPTVSKVDAGTMEVVRSFGAEVVSSADLLQRHTCVWTDCQLKSHLFAANVLDMTVSKVWRFLKERLSENQHVSEYDIQQFILGEIAEHHCLSADFPICAVNAHSADPHYTPSKGSFSLINEGDFILIDLWCRQNHAHAVYADITRVAVAAPQPSARQQEIFNIVKKARDSATAFVKDRLENQIPVMGYEIDEVCRGVINAAGYGEYFIHRTGHNIDHQDHGPGANIDNLETQDKRLILPRTCFSIEPGIYLPGEFGVRLEYDVFVHTDGNIQITGGIQDNIESLF